MAYIGGRKVSNILWVATTERQYTLNRKRAYSMMCTQVCHVGLWAMGHVGFSGAPTLQCDAYAKHMLIIVAGARALLQRVPH